MSATLKKESTSDNKASTLTEALENNANNIPQHIAIIMDGNRRWARDHNLPAALGHWKGAETIMDIVKEASAMGVKVLTLFAFSTENWRRSLREIESLINLFKVYLQHKKEEMIAEGVRLDAIGNIERFPQDLQDTLLEVKEATKNGNKIDLVLALSYGGRDDIVRAVKSILQDQSKGVLEAENLTEELFGSYLDTSKWPDPDLLIRTSGEKRLSNFLLWQISYTEVVITDVLWPDFTQQDLKQAIQEFQQRKRRRGGL